MFFQICVIFSFIVSTFCKTNQEHEIINLTRFPRQAVPVKTKSTESSSRITNESVPLDDGIPDFDLPIGYNRFEIPKNKTTGPLDVFIQLNIMKILHIDEENEEVKLDVQFRVFWTDYKILELYNGRRARKGLAPITIKNLTTQEIRKKRKTLNNPLLLQKLWKPNLFFENLLKAKQPVVISQLITLKVIPEAGWFEYLTRLIITINCEMGFKYYPADTQICDFAIRGFSYTKENLHLNWYGTGVYLWDLKLPNFDTKIDNLHHRLLEEDGEDPAADQFNVLGFSLLARRRLSYHFVQTYMTSTFYIIITCLCFLLPAYYVDARIGISMTTLLALTSMFASVRENTPKVSYVKALDVWMVGCIFFVFLTLAEFTLHIWLQTVKNAATNEEDDDDSISNGITGVTTRSKSRGKFPTSLNNEYPLHCFKSGRIRKLSRLPSAASTVNVERFQKLKIYEKCFSFIEQYSFPVFFILLCVFTIIYWTWLLVSSEYFSWDIDKTYNNLDSMKDKVTPWR